MECVVVVVGSNLHPLACYYQLLIIFYHFHHEEFPSMHDLQHEYFLVETHLYSKSYLYHHNEPIPHMQYSALYEIWKSIVQCKP